MSAEIDKLRTTVAGTPPAPDATAGYLRKVHERAYTVVDADVEALKAAGFNLRAHSLSPHCLGVLASSVPREALMAAGF